MIFALELETRFVISNQYHHHFCHISKALIDNYPTYCIFLFDTHGGYLTKITNVTETIEKVSITKQIFLYTISV